MNDALKVLLGNKEGTEIEVVRYHPLTYNMVVVYSYISPSSYYGEERKHYGKKYFRKREICNEILKCMTKDEYTRIQAYNVNNAFSEISEKLDETVFIRKDFPGNIFLNFEVIYEKSCISLHIPWDENSFHDRQTYFYTNGRNVKLLDRDKIKFSPYFLDTMSEMENQVPGRIKEFLKDADLYDLFEQQLLIHEIGEI